MILLTHTHTLKIIRKRHTFETTSYALRSLDAVYVMTMKTNREAMEAKKERNSSHPIFSSLSFSVNKREAFLASQGNSCHKTVALAVQFALVKGIMC